MRRLLAEAPPPPNPPPPPPGPPPPNPVFQMPNALRSHSKKRFKPRHGRTFVPIDTTKNLATPIPTINAPQPKSSYFDRLYDSLAKVLPFPRRNRKPYLPAPMAPIMPPR